MYLPNVSSTGRGGSGLLRLMFWTVTSTGKLLAARRAIGGGRRWMTLPVRLTESGLWGSAVFRILAVDLGLPDSL